jgi:signal transduction histidine kinase
VDPQNQRSTRPVDSRSFPLVIGEDVSTSPRGVRPELRIALTYWIVASIWIVASDFFLTHSTPEPVDRALMQTLKGLNFVLTTAILLFLVLRRAYSGWRAAEEKRAHGAAQDRERLRSLSAYVQTLREEERTRIAREIHDELGQLLTGIKMEVRLIENRLADRDDRSLNPIIDRLVEASEMVDATITSIQRISAGLRPSTLDDLGLATALREEAALFSERSGIHCTITIEGTLGELPPEVVTNTFRIFQEALTNVARHAEARHITSRIAVCDGGLILEIHDDGKGIDLDDLQDLHASGSLGLIGMLERAESMQGKIEFRRELEQGTSVILTIPLPAGKTNLSSPV